MLSLCRVGFAKLGLPLRATLGFFSGSCGDYRLPVCCPGSGHIGQRRIVQETFVLGHTVMGFVRRTDKQHQGGNQAKKKI
jgi:hypothetical protein